MQPKLLLLAFLLMDSLCSFSQQDTIKPPSLSAPNIFLELGGNGIFLSINYDRRFSKKQNGLGYRLGVGLIPSLDFGIAGTSTILVIPFGLNYLAGKGSHYFEAGAGGTFVSGNAEILGDDSKGSGIAFVPSLGYRYQPQIRGFTGRAAITPFITGEGTVILVGISGGIRF